MTTILLVPGAWITPAAYQPFLETLKGAGYEALCASYPSLDPKDPKDPKDPTKLDVQVDTDAIAATLRPIVEEGKDVLLLLHSYAGMPGAAAAVGLSRSQRAAEGKTGGVVGLLFIGAFVVAEGGSCAGLQDGKLPQWILLDTPSPGLNEADKPEQNFAADFDSDQVKSLVKEMKPHATLPFTSPQPHPAWADKEFEGRLAFIVTTNDQAVPEAAQRGMMDATEKKWIVKEMSSSHCAPFFNHTETTATLVREILAEIDKV